MVSLSFQVFLLIKKIYGSYELDTNSYVDVICKDHVTPLEDICPRQALSELNAIFDESKCACFDIILTSEILGLNNASDLEIESIMQGEDYINVRENNNINKCFCTNKDLIVLEDSNNTSKNILEETVPEIDAVLHILHGSHNLSISCLYTAKYVALSKLCDNLIDILDSLYICTYEIEERIFKLDVDLKVRARAEILKFVLQNIDDLSLIRSRYLVPTLQKNSKEKHLAWKFDMIKASRFLSGFMTMLRKCRIYDDLILEIMLENVKKDLRTLDSGCKKVTALENSMLEHLKPLESNNSKNFYVKTDCKKDFFKFDEIFNDFCPILRNYKGFLKNKKQRLLNDAVDVHKRDLKMPLIYLSDLKRLNKTLRYLAWGDCLKKDINRDSIDIKNFCNSRFFKKTLTMELIDDVEKEMENYKQKILKDCQVEENPISSKEKRSYINKYKKIIQRYKQKVNKHATFFHGVENTTANDDINNIAPNNINDPSISKIKDYSEIVAIQQPAGPQISTEHIDSISNEVTTNIIEKTESFLHNDENVVKQLQLIKAVDGSMFEYSVDKFSNIRHIEANKLQSIQEEEDKIEILVKENEYKDLNCDIHGHRFLKDGEKDPPSEESNLFKMLEEDKNYEDVSKSERSEKHIGCNPKSTFLICVTPSPLNLSNINDTLGKPVSDEKLDKCLYNDTLIRTDEINRNIRRDPIQLCSQDSTGQSKDALYKPLGDMKTPEISSFAIQNMLTGINDNVQLLKNQSIIDNVESCKINRPLCGLSKDNMQHTTKLPALSGDGKVCEPLNWCDFKKSDQDVKHFNEIYATKEDAELSVQIEKESLDSKPGVYEENDIRYNSNETDWMEISEPDTEKVFFEENEKGKARWQRSLKVLCVLFIFFLGGIVSLLYLCFR